VAGKSLHVSPAIKAVMRAILEAPADRPAWGMSICEQTGYGTETVYPALHKLLRAEWVTDRWEAPVTPGSFPRRFYTPAYTPSWYENRIAVTEKRWWQRS
jgi:PadR family transcriptional regulator, regulatory protein PadR